MTKQELRICASIVRRAGYPDYADKLDKLTDTLALLAAEQKKERSVQHA